MYTKTKLLRITTMVCAALLLTLAAAPARIEKALSANNNMVTTMRMSGRSADIILFDAERNINGFLNASKDNITGNTFLEFGYSTAHLTDPDILVIFQGFGEIPDTGFTITSVSAQLASANLAVTTPDSFLVNYCEVNQTNGEFFCVLTDDTFTFDLTWIKTSFGMVQEKVNRIVTFGPITTKFQGQFVSFTANVNGTWSDRLGVTNVSNLAGNLTDSQNSSVFREITVQANP